MGMCENPDTCPECQAARNKIRKMIGRDNENGLKNFAKKVDEITVADRRKRTRTWAAKFESNKDQF